VELGDQRAVLAIERMWWHWAGTTREACHNSWGVGLVCGQVPRCWDWDMVDLNKVPGMIADCIAFFTVMTLLEGKSMTDVEKKWKSDFVPTLQTNWMV
jgi:hypothetical protein